MGRYGSRCNCYNSHNSNSGRCHHSPDLDLPYCDDCVKECGQVNPLEFSLWFTRETRDLEIHYGKEEFHIKFVDDDEWNAITLANGEVWDVHLLTEYGEIEDEGTLEFSVYPVVNGESQVQIETPIWTYILEK